MYGDEERLGLGATACSVSPASSLSLLTSSLRCPVRGISTGGGALRAALYAPRGHCSGPMSLIRADASHVLDTVVGRPPSACPSGLLTHRRGRGQWACGHDTSTTVIQLCASHTVPVLRCGP